MRKSAGVVVFKWPGNNCDTLACELSGEFADDVTPIIWCMADGDSATGVLFT